MPYRSKAQAAYIHAQAQRGVKWAQKFVNDSHGTHVQDSSPRVKVKKKYNLKNHHKKRAKRSR
jgi:hypothetical protein